MGVSSSNANTGVQGDVLDSETINRNIMRVFQERQLSNNYSDVETLNWNTDKARHYLHGGVTARNRYDRYNPEALINELVNQVNKPQAGGIPQGHESSDYKEVSDDVVRILRKNIINQTDPNTQQGGSCGCDGGSSLVSATSPQPVDYNVLKGGAKEKDEEDKNKDKKSKKKNKDEEKKDEEKDEDEDEEIDIDEEEEDLDEPEDVEEESMERTHAERKQSRDKRNSKRHNSRSESSSSSEQSAGLEDIIKPFYSSDSDYYNIKQRTGRSG